MVETDPEKKQGLTQTVGYYMKLAYGNWHKEPVHDDMIKNELKEISGGLLTYETGGYRVQYDTPRPSNNFKQRNNNNNNSRNFKGQGGNSQAGQGGQRPNNNFRDRDATAGGGGGGNYGGNKFKNKNKNKFK